MVLHFLPHISIFALSQNNQTFKNTMYASYSILFKELKNGSEILVDQQVMDQNSQNVVWICNSKFARSTLILILFLSSLDNLL